METPTATPDAQLLAAARRAAGRAYAPYSSFSVGAAALAPSGAVTLGCNVENAAYGETICAERNAVTTLVAEREPGEAPALEAVAVVGLKANPCWPCGACRQVLREFGCRRVVVEGPDGEALSVPFEEILPHSFGPEALEGR
ncbi:cytidine deaminase [Corynebacterium otitidis]